MTMHQLFSTEEWQVLQFAVLDVVMMVSQIDGASGMDEAESNAFMDLLENPASAENLLVQELLASIAPTWKHVLDAYQSQYRFDPAYFENAFSRVKALVDSRLSKSEAQDFKFALAMYLGGVIANASGSGATGMGRISDTELKAMTVIAKWLGTDMTQTKKQDRLETLLETLHHGSAPERAGAAEEIGLLTPVVKAAVPALIQALGDADANVRYNVAQALMLMGAAAFPAIPALTRVFTDDDNPEVRESAVWGLNGIAKDIGLGPHTTQLVPLLINALRDQSEGMRGAAAATLGVLVLPDPAEVIAALQRVAENQDEDKGVRAVAFQATERLRNK